MKNKYFDVKKIISKNLRSSKFIGEKDGQEYFVKRYEDEEKTKREYENQKFLYEISKGKNSGFSFLQPKKIDSFIYYPALSVEDNEWLADGNLPGSHFNDLDSYQEELFSFFRFCHEDIEFADIPDSMKQRYQDKGDEHYLENCDESAEYLQSKDLLSKSEIEKLRDVLEKNVDKRAFQHHDVVPWHMVKGIDSGEITLIDPEWSDWSLWAYDIAYFILQIVGYAERVDDAKNFYNKIAGEYKDKEDFDELLHCALAYRGSRLIPELHEQGKVSTLDKVIEITKQGGFK